MDRKALSRKATAMDAAALRLAITGGDVLVVGRVFKVTPGYDDDWRRETDGMQVGEVAAVLAWMRWKRDAIRLPSGFRVALGTWRELKPETRKDLAASLLGELGVTWQ